MSDEKPSPYAALDTETRLTHLGRDPEHHFGFVNLPVYRGSTILYPSVEAIEKKDLQYTYGRRGTPLVRALEEAVTELEKGHRSVLAPSGLNAIACTLLGLLKAGDHILVTDSVYQPARKICDGLLKRLGIETEYYDPRAGGTIADRLRDNTRLIYTETPGSQTFEMQDLPAISAVAQGRDIFVVADNTWATPLYCNPLELGADVVIHAGTKYFGGHSDANLGSITANERAYPLIKAAHGDMGVCPGPEDVFLCLRGLRTLAVRLARHNEAALEMARWLKGRAEVARVLHPALEDDPGHALWQRDFRGASGLFSVVLNPV
ncbi:MAG: cystathionine beta-lyase, partial [Alphaproteobacteria bacterium]